MLKYLVELLLLVVCVGTASAQDILIYEKGNEKPVAFPFGSLDSVSINPCDTTIYDLAGCDLDIDSTVVSVTCGNLVSVSSTFDGTPTFIKYTIYDSIGTVLFTSSGSADISFTLPDYGVFYGTIEVACGDRETGDEDEDAFEIVNAAPVANFDITTIFAATGSGPVRTVNLSDQSQEEGILIHSYTVKQLSSGAVSTYTSANAVFATDPARGYEVTLDVQDPKGCTSRKIRMIDSIEACQARFDWEYSWCDPCKSPEDTTSVNVKFFNHSQWLTSQTPTYKWDFGDGTFSTATDPTHAYTVSCSGRSFNVSLTIELGNVGDSDYCQSVWDTTITINQARPELLVTRICCDGLVFFSTDAVKGKWSTPGSMNKPKWPAVSKKIWKPLGVQIGQSYRQYYTAGSYSVDITGAISEDHNRCPVRKTFTVSAVECFNRNVTVKGSDIVDGITIKYKFKAIALPFVHKLKSKVRSGWMKKLAEASTDFSGAINRQDASGCFCATQLASMASGLKTNKRKAVASTSTSGRFRVGMNKLTANFHIKTKAGTSRDYQLQLGVTPCDYPWFLFF